MVTFPASRNKLNRTTEFCTFCKRSIKNLGRPYSNELQLSNSQGLVEEPVHLGFFGYESSGWQATICGDRVNVGEKGVGRSGKLLQASNLQQ